MNNLFEQLKNLGLNRSESQIYIYLLENGLSTPPQIAKGTNIARTNCYNILFKLKGGNLIEEQTNNKRKAYIASDPEALLRTLDKQRESTIQLLPDLRALYTTQKNKPKIKFYDGFEQVKALYQQSLEAKEIYAIGSTNKLWNLDNNFLKKYYSSVTNRNIIFHDLLSQDSTDVTESTSLPILKGLYNQKYLPKKYTDAPTDILIWDDNIALITLSEPIFGTILNNKLLAETFKMLFAIIWEKI